MGRNVTSIGERVEPGLFRGERQQRAHMVDMRVDAAVGDEPEQVRPLAAFEGGA